MSVISTAATLYPSQGARPQPNPHSLTHTPPLHIIITHAFIPPPSILTLYLHLSTYIFTLHAARIICIDSAACTPSAYLDWSPTHSHAAERACTNIESSPCSIEFLQLTLRVQGKLPMGAQDRSRRRSYSRLANVRSSWD
ncbi:hypothetical protein BU23DRAFT_49729 [Bimuria novae-zelandiae CBS 107.79]|uniref:Uncharacterized protein n=1 Tax=Bimuria novae-zelandiae CBS 107.79 TaxID=1447943 RepID=A0A6A5UI35_9PLEO|nr:hypothetical protein BU23DRAFT_49729 [Bimuria novae-zelandiae CBS 107.79]